METYIVQTKDTHSHTIASRISENSNTIPDYNHFQIPYFQILQSGISFFFRKTTSSKPQETVLNMSTKITRGGGSPEILPPKFVIFFYISVKTINTIFPVKIFTAKSPPPLNFGLLYYYITLIPLLTAKTLPLCIR